MRRYRQSYKVMLIVMRLGVWVLETAFAAVLLGVLMLSLLGAFIGPGAHGFFLDVLRYAAVTLIVFMWGSGYLLTTAVAGIVCRNWKPWLYPIAAAILFIVHVGFFASGWENIEEPSLRYESLMIQYVGACIVLGCDLLGNVLLRKWEGSISRSSADIGSV